MFPVRAVLPVLWRTLTPAGAAEKPGVMAAATRWPTIEPRKGEWNWEKADALVKAATDNHFEITACMMGTVPWSGEKSHTFPMSDLEAWSGFIGQSVARYKDRIHYWEVWNEGNGGFNGGHHTSADYGRLASATYIAAKKADPSAQVGLIDPQATQADFILPGVTVMSVPSVLFRGLCYVLLKHSVEMMQ